MKDKYFDDNNNKDKEKPNSRTKRPIPSSMDEGLKSRREELIDKKKAEGQQNRLKIVTSLLKAYSTRDKERQEGVSVSDLIKDTRLTRQTVYNILQRLAKDNFVRKIGNKQGGIYLTSTAFNDHAFRAYFFVREVIRRLIGPGPTQQGELDPAYIFNAVQIWKSSKFCNTSVGEKIARKYYDRISKMRERYGSMTIIPPAHDVDEDALWLFELANRVGFLIVYTFLQTLNPKQVDEAMIDIIDTTANSNPNRNPSSSSSSHLHIDSRNRALLRDTLSFSWVDNALVLNIRDLLTAFTNQWFITQRLKIRPGFIPGSDDSQSIFEMNQDDFNHLTAAFAAAYPPKYYEEMDKIRRESGKIASTILEDSSRWAREHKTKLKTMKK
jgi:hypothetical protein